MKGLISTVNFIYFFDRYEHENFQILSLETRWPFLKNTLKNIYISFALFRIIFILISLSVFYIFYFYFNKEKEKKKMSATIAWKLSIRISGIRVKGHYVHFMIN